MNVMQRAERAYSDNIAPIKSDSQIEYDAFARISRQLNIAVQNKKNDFPAFAKALNENRMLWRILAIDVADKANALPQDLRAQIFFLAEFTEAHTKRVLAEGAAIDPLTDLNLSIMRGLNSREQLV